MSVNNGFTDLQFSVYANEREEKWFYNSFVKELKDFGVLIRNLEIGNVVELENKIYKGRVVLKKNNFDGDLVKVQLKRKENNKKVGEIEMSMERMGKLKSNEMGDVHVPAKNMMK